MRVYYYIGRKPWFKNLISEDDIRSMGELDVRLYIFNLSSALRELYNSTVKYPQHNKLNSKSKETLSKAIQEAKNLYREVFCREYVEIPKWGLPNQKEAKRVEAIKEARAKEAEKNKEIKEKKNKTKNRERVKAANRQNPVRKNKSKQDGQGTVVV